MEINALTVINQKYKLEKDIQKTEENEGQIENKQTDKSVK